MNQINMESILDTNFKFPKQKKAYKGKVRDMYILEDDTLIMITSDRVSAFDVIMPKGIPYKGQVINQIATKFMDATQDIIPNWKIASPDPNVTIGRLCKPFKIEMVIRGFLVGHIAREYASGKRIICGNRLPQNIKENQKFEQPIITPTSKADIGNHDEDISKQEILKKGLVSEKDYEQIELYTYKLFERGSKIAAEKGLILVDTKYEFGKTTDGKIVLIDEVHTPDSSRYFYADNYEENFNKGLAQKQLSKEFVRQWLIEQGFQGKKWHQIPNMDDNLIKLISERYIELYQILLGESFLPENKGNAITRIENNVMQYLSK